MTSDDNRDVLTALITEIEGFGPRTFPSGYLARQVRLGDFEEAGVTFRVDDGLLGHVYVGLAVLTRDLDRYLDGRSETAGDPARSLFRDVSGRVHKAEAGLWGAKAWPEYAGQPDKEVAALPTGLAAAAATGHPTVAGLGSGEIVHEWTFKAGKRLFLAFVQRLGAACKELACDNLKPRLEKGRLQDEALRFALVAVATGLGGSPLWLPVAAYVGVGVATKGLKSYCALEEKKGELIIPTSW